MRHHQSLPATVVVAANLILIGAAVACLFVLSYYGYYYGWTRQRTFSSWVGVFLYCILPAALAPSATTTIAYWRDPLVTFRR